MKALYALFPATLSFIAAAQPQLPTFYTTDTVTIPCPQDTTVNILTYVGWEAYQTLDDTWNGPRDSSVCIDLAHVINPSYVASRILIDQIEPARPVFLRALLDDQSVIPLSSDNEYSISFGAFTANGFDAGPCPDGPCSSARAAVRIPDAAGSGTILRWSETSLSTDPMSPFLFNLCVPTEKFANNHLREVVFSFLVLNAQPGQSIDLYGSLVLDFDLDGSLQRITPAVLPQFLVGQDQYTFGYQWGSNYLVMHANAEYPDLDHVFDLDFSPVPNQPVPIPVTVNMEPYTGFNFQPFTQLRGGLLEGSTTDRHPLSVVNNGADLCLGIQFVEMVWLAKSCYVHRSGHIAFRKDATPASSSSRGARYALRMVAPSNTDRTVAACC
ncbi:MAG: hypothetical protein IPI81_11840 [Flavobacteriales bacterium]|nr:hypothetical protein [Flavobacteriales bacterium]